MYWFDLTTTQNLRGAPPVGLKRVEVQFAQAALRRLNDRCGFMTFNRYGRTWETMEPDAVHGLLAAAQSNERGVLGAPRPSGLLRAAGRNLERGFRRGMRGLAHVVARRFGGHAKPRFTRGDTLLMLGDSWTRREMASVPALLRENDMRLIVLINDCIPHRFPHYFDSRDFVQAFLEFLEVSLRHAHLILHGSQSAAVDLRAFAAERGLPMPPLYKLAMGADLPNAAPSPPQRVQAWLRGRPFALSVSTIQIRKNHQLLFNLWRRFLADGIAPMPLVLCGSPGWIARDLVDSVRRDRALADLVLIADDVDDDGLAWLYGQCAFTLYPSLYEGWGLPIAESLGYGKPCIASNASSMPEVAQGLATLLDPLDFAAWRAQVSDLMTNPARRAAEIARIGADYRMVTWAEAGDRFISELERGAAISP